MSGHQDRKANIKTGGSEYQQTLEQSKFRAANNALRKERDDALKAVDELVPQVATLEAKIKALTAYGDQDAKSVKAELQEWRSAFEGAFGVVTATPRKSMYDVAEEHSTTLKEKAIAYSERDQLVALVANLALAIGSKAGLGRHDESDKAWEKDWMNIVFIELPVGQISFHIHDSEMPLFSFLGKYESKWDGHDTPTKWERVKQQIENDQGARAIRDAEPPEETRG